MSKQILDTLGNNVKIGDTIIIAKFSELLPCKLLGISEKSLKVSCLRKKWLPDNKEEANKRRWQNPKGKWIPDSKGEVFDEHDLSLHNSSKRLVFWRGVPNKINSILKIN